MVVGILGLAGLIIIAWGTFSGKAYHMIHALLLATYHLDRSFCLVPSFCIQVLIARVRKKTSILSHYHPSPLHSMFYSSYAHQGKENYYIHTAYYDFLH